MCAKLKQEAQNPLIVRCHRLMEAFAKSDDERDFYLDRQEGFLIFVDIDKPQAELDALEAELESQTDRYCAIPKLSFYETKKIMEGFVNEKVYDIDTKEKLLDIIQSKEAKENFLEFIYDHHAEQEKWQQFYLERSRIRIIEWLRQNHFHFVFEEDLDLPRQTIEKLKQSLFQTKVGKDILNARKALVTRAKTYYSNEALNPRPKRGRPPKQAVKPDIEPQITLDIYTTVPPTVLPFLFVPDINPNSQFSIFSSKFDSEESLLSRRQEGDTEASLNQKLASLRALSNSWNESSTSSSGAKKSLSNFDDDDDAIDFNFDEDDDDDDDDIFDKPKSKSKSKEAAQAKPKSKPVPAKTKASTKETSKATAKQKTPLKTTRKPVLEKFSSKIAVSSATKPKVKRIMPVKKTVKAAKTISKKK